MEDDDEMLLLSQPPPQSQVAERDDLQGIYSQQDTEPEAAERWHKESKYINDPVHGEMRFDWRLVAFMDTPCFQRLRYLRQLGAAYLVYPGATHTRFEHSLGVGYMAFKCADKIWAKQRSMLDIHQDDVVTVGLAGLCHDLGHGPFSHVFETVVRARGVPKAEWEHEDMSCSMFDHIRDTHNLDCITDEQASLVKQLIKGKPGGASEKVFLFDIVANKRTSIDVDKMDYLQRDALHCGVKISCDFKRILNRSTVIDNRICYKWNIRKNVSQLFQDRLSMFERVYTHCKVKGMELMIMDALAEADLELDFVKPSIYDPARYARLDDSLLRNIEHFEHVWPHLAGSAPLRRAAEVVQRLRRRELYRFVDEIVVPADRVASWKPPSAADLCSCWQSDGLVQLNPDEVIISVNCVNWAKEDKNPLLDVHWYDKRSPHTAFTSDDRRINTMRQEVFQEKQLRVYSKRDDPKVEAALRKALAEYEMKAGFFNSSREATPLVAQPTENGTSPAYMPARAAAMPQLSTPQAVGDRRRQRDAGAGAEEDMDQPDSTRRRLLG